FEDISEAQLHTAVGLLSKAMCDALGCWWLPEGRMDARTPNWDIASTATIQGRLGLMLVEAKAHDTELLKEAVGRSLEARDSGDQEARAASHSTIGTAIDQARVGLCASTGLTWQV